MDDCTFLATPPSEPKRVFDVIDNPVLQVNYPWCGSREENTQERRRGCGMWVMRVFGTLAYATCLKTYSPNFA